MTTTFIPDMDPNQQRNLFTEDECEGGADEHGDISAANLAAYTFDDN